MWLSSLLAGVSLYWKHMFYIHSIQWSYEIFSGWKGTKLLLRWGSKMGAGSTYKLKDEKTGGWEEDDEGQK